MLLEFRVGNYRSIRDEQTLSLVATNDISLSETHLITPNIKSFSGKVVRSAAIYGANASGKSTLLHALNYMRAVVMESASLIQPGQIYNVQPFKLEANFLSKPTEFELSFSLNNIRYQYSFGMTANGIHSESLNIYNTAKPTLLFSRVLAGDKNSVYKYGTELRGSRKLWEDSTRPNALYLSTAAQLNSELLSPIFECIVQSILFLPSGADVNHDLTTAMLTSVEGREKVKDFLISADISITDIQAVSQKGLHNRVTIQPDGVTHSSTEEAEYLVPVFVHATANGKATFDFAEESQGTQRIYGLVAPVLNVIEHGKALVIDELDSSLHPLLAKRLIAIFHNPAINTKGAQLIFSTHDTSLLDPNVFRRDQVWFTEKNADQATILYPLTDFNPRKTGAWEKAYLQGRFGAVPFFEINN